MAELDRVLYDPSESGYHTFRVPALLAVGEHLLAFCEGRSESSTDSGAIDVVLRRSADGGRSWSALQIVASAAGMTCGNPVPILDPASGDVVLITVRNGAAAQERDIAAGRVVAGDARRIYLRRSIDLGRSWSEPIEITADVKRPDWGWYATGPGHGIAVVAGTHAGRLVVPANHSVITEQQDAADHYGGHCLYSDDGGHTWKIGFVDDHGSDGDVNANETTVAELADGRLVFNTRNHRGRSRRAQAISYDGGQTIDSPFQQCPEFAGDETQAGMISPDGRRLVLCTVGDPNDRRRLTAYWSEDAGSWRPTMIIHPGPSGYCDLQPVGDDRIGILYEAGESDYREQIRFTVRSTRELAGD